MSEVLLGLLTAEVLRPEATSPVSDCPPALSPPPPRPTVPGEGSSGPSATQLGERKEGFVARPSPAPSYPVTISGSKSPGCARGTSALCEGAGADQRPAVPVPFHVATWETPVRRRSPREPGRLLPAASAIQPLPSPVPFLLWLPLFNTPSPLLGGPFIRPAFSLLSGDKGGTCR